MLSSVMMQLTVELIDFGQIRNINYARKMGFILTSQIGIHAH